MSAREVLQQSATFGPFPRESVMLRKVAMLTRDNQIANVVGGDARSYNTAQGKRMVNMMVSPLDLVTTVVTLALLPVVLLSDLFGGMGTWDGHFNGLSASVSRSIRLSVGKIVLPLVFMDLLFVSTGVLVVVGTPLLLVLLPIVLENYRVMFNALSVISLASLRTAFFAFSLQAVLAHFATVSRVKVLRSSRKNFFADIASLKAFWDRIKQWTRGMSVVSTYTWLTSRIQAIAACRATREVPLGCRELLFALWTAFHGGAVRGHSHSLNRLSFSCLIPSCCQGDKASTFSHGVITPMLGNMSIIPQIGLISHSVAHKFKENE